MVEFSKEKDKSYYEGQELSGLEGAVNYYRWLLREFSPFIGRNVLEIGAGTGTFSRHLLSLPIERLICIEPAENLFPLLDRNLADLRVVKICCSLEGFIERKDRQKGFDTVVCVDVLEHIYDDAGALRAIYSLLNPGGSCCLFVPALSWLYGSLDQVFGHHRRYHKAGLRKLLTRVGFEVQVLKYFHFTGVFTWFLMGWILRWQSWSGGAVQFYDRWVVKPLSFVEKLVPPPLGQSLLAVARR